MRRSQRGCLRRGSEPLAIGPPATKQVIVQLAYSILIVSGLVAVALAVKPAQLAPILGANGTAVAAFSAYLIVAAVLQGVGRRWAHWTAFDELNLESVWPSRRTPWNVLALVWFALASLLNTSGGYHDVRTTELAAGVTPGQVRHGDVASAFNMWLEAQDESLCATDPNGPVPMVLVAAPGGGIRAAYWTTIVLDELFPDDCRRQRLFAISGASGGTVGSVLWSAATLGETAPESQSEEGDASPASKAVTAIAGDEPLSVAVAGLLLRDLPQPITGLGSAWEDRAALLEDEWISRSEVLGTVDKPLTWSGLNGGSTKAGRRF